MLMSFVNRERSSFLLKIHVYESCGSWESQSVMERGEFLRVTAIEYIELCFFSYHISTSICFQSVIPSSNTLDLVCILLSEMVCVFKVHIFNCACLSLGCRSRIYSIIFKVIVCYAFTLSICSILSRHSGIFKATFAKYLCIIPVYVAIFIFSVDVFELFLQHLEFLENPSLWSQ